MIEQLKPLICFAFWCKYEQSSYEVEEIYNRQKNQLKVVVTFNCRNCSSKYKKIYTYELP